MTIAQANGHRRTRRADTMPHDRPAEAVEPDGRAVPPTSQAAAMRAHPVELTAVPGIGTAKAALLAAAFELVRRRDVVHEQVRIRSTSDIAALVAPDLRDLPREQAVVVVCDRAGRVLARETISAGASDRTLLPVREILVTVLRHDGQSFAIAHNHPSGDPTPSKTDIDATRRIAEAARAADLRFLDHVIIAGTRWNRVHS